MHGTTNLKLTEEILHLLVYVNFISVVILEDHMFEVTSKVKITKNRIAIPLFVQFMYCMHHCIK
jgi:hypothetical protein